MHSLSLAMQTFNQMNLREREREKNDFQKKKQIIHYLKYIKYASHSGWNETRKKVKQTYESNERLTARERLRVALKLNDCYLIIH